MKFSCFCPALVCLSLCVLPVRAGEFFLDDFEDGNATDGSPATWAHSAPPFDQGNFAVVNGSLAITPATSGTPPFPNLWETDVYLANQLYHDVNVHAQFRALAQGSSWVGINALDTEATQGRSGVYATGFIVQDGANRFLRITQNDSAIATSNTTLSQLTDELNMRFVVTGLRASLTAWPLGTPEPAPQLSVTLPASYASTEGHVTIWAGNRTTSVPVAFRFVNVVPEPASITIAFVMILMLLGSIRSLRTKALSGGSQ
jgi:hypothetical protein